MAISQDKNNLLFTRHYIGLYRLYLIFQPWSQHVGVWGAPPPFPTSCFPNKSPAPLLSLGTSIPDWRVPPAPCQPTHLLDKPREMLGKKMLLYLSDGQLNNSLFHCTILMKLGLFKEFCPPEPLWRFSPKLQHFAAPHLGFTNSCF